MPELDRAQRRRRNTALVVVLAAYVISFFQRLAPAGIAHDLGEAAPAAIDRAEVILFPNPISDEAINVRFWADGDGPGQGGFSCWAVLLVLRGVSCSVWRARWSWRWSDVP